MASGIGSYTWSNHEHKVVGMLSEIRCTIFNFRIHFVSCICLIHNERHFEVQFHVWFPTSKFCLFKFWLHFMFFTLYIILPLNFIYYFQVFDSIMFMWYYFLCLWYSNVSFDDVLSMVHNLHTTLVPFEHHVTLKLAQLHEMSSRVPNNPCSIIESVFEMCWFLLSLFSPLSVS